MQGVTMKILSAVVLAATLCLASSARAQSPELTQISMFAPPTLEGFISYPSGQYCGVPHIYMLDSSSTASDFTPTPLPDGVHTFRFVTSTFFQPQDPPAKLHLFLQPCCQVADLIITPGETASTTIGNTTYT